MWDDAPSLAGRTEPVIPAKAGISMVPSLRWDDGLAGMTVYVG